MAPSKALIRAADIAHAIFVLRGHKGLLEGELAALYGITSKRFNEQVRRNRERPAAVGAGA
jgi:hypothetical protein